MLLYRVLDLATDEVGQCKYDLTIFASGYEERSTHVPRQREQIVTKEVLVLGFKEVNQNKQRQDNDRYFERAWRHPIPVASDDDGAVYDLLRTLAKDEAEVRILIDYSSMSRVWYTALLNWARFVGGKRKIIIDFLYAVGDHKKPAPPLVINDIVSLPGCEGLPRPLCKSVAVFGLGFEGSAALCVLDRLEPDELYSFIADPAAFPEYPKRTRSTNAAVIHLSSSCLSLPLFSVQRCFTALSEIVSPYRGETNITLVPMGPKPHVLAAILIALRFPEITCLRVGYRRHEAEDIGTTGDVVATRIEFISDP